MITVSNIEQIFISLIRKKECVGDLTEECKETKNLHLQETLNFHIEELRKLKIVWQEIEKEFSKSKIRRIIYKVDKEGVQHYCQLFGINIDKWLAADGC